MATPFQRQPLASTSQLLDSPSTADGIPREKEADFRAAGAMYIQQAGVLLALPQIAVASASILFQRFWFVSSLKHFGVIDIALASVFLAAKLEEHPLRARDLINVFDFMLKWTNNDKASAAVNAARAKAREMALQRKETTNGQQTVPAHVKFEYEPMDLFAKTYYDMKEETVIGEMQILKRLGFNLTIQHPYGSLVNYLQVLGLTDHPVIPQRSWAFCNDALLTPAYAVYPSTAIATAAIYLACLYSAKSETPVVLPMKPKPWWELFGVRSEKQLWEICQPLLDLYSKWATTDLDCKSQPPNAQTLWMRMASSNLPLTKAAVKDYLA